MEIEPTIGNEAEILFDDIMLQFAAFLAKAENCRQHHEWLGNAAMRVYLRKTLRIR